MPGKATADGLLQNVHGVMLLRSNSRTANKHHFLAHVRSGLDGLLQDVHDVLLLRSNIRIASNQQQHLSEQIEQDYVCCFSMDVHDVKFWNATAALHTKSISWHRLSQDSMGCIKVYLVLCFGVYE